MVSGRGGGPAIANILFGEVNPSAKLPVTFARAEGDLPHAEIAGLSLMPQPGAGGPGGFGGGRGGMPPFDVPYTEKLQVGYKWFDAQNKEPLFRFGSGLSYTTYAYSGMHAAASGHSLTVSFNVKNTGKRAGKEIVQVYATLPASAGEPPKRLIGWQKVELAAGESKTINLAVDPLYLSIFNERGDRFEVTGGSYKIWSGGSSGSLPLSQTVDIGN